MHWISNQIDQLTEELNTLQKQYAAYKRGTNRKLDDTMITKFPKIEAEIKKVNDRIDAILEFDVIKKETKKNKKAYYLP